MALMVRLLPLVLGLALPASAAGVTDAIAMAREERPVPIPEGGPTAPRLVPPSTPETEDEDGMPSSEGEDPRRSGGEDRPRTGPVEREIAPAGLPAREAPELVPPRPLTTLAVPLPEGVPPPDEEILVRVLLTIDESGAVVDARLLEGAGPPWDDAVLDAARGFSFEPARLGETAVQVEIPYEHRFLPPPPPEPEAPSARLHGRLVEMGTVRPIPGALVEAEVGGRVFRTHSEADGRFSLDLPPGEAQVEVILTGYRRFLVREPLEEGREVEVRYLVERERYDPYETVVIGRAERKEVSRTTLRDREIRQVPGTFGDPFRVVGTLPGVTQTMSLIAYPIVRGSNPGATGILIDGIRVPQLFHFLGGPAVIHPSFIDRVDFYPGNFPVDYGGYTGGIIDGVTRPAARDERALDLGIDLTNTSLFVREPVFGANATLAGRYGYPGFVLGMFSDEVVLDYWDYQARLDGGKGGHHWTVFAFGAYDELGERNQTVSSDFHRLDLRLRQRAGSGFDLYRLSLGVDRLRSSGEVGVWTARVDPRAQWVRPLSERITLRLGADIGFKRVFFDGIAAEEGGDDARRFVSDLLTVGAWTDLPTWVGKDLLLTPGFRVDAYEATVARQASFDPRLLARYRLWENEEDSAWLKGGVGLYSQPPRFPIPLPGLDDIALEYGLGQSAQASFGGEYETRSGFAFDVQAFFTYMDPIFLEVESVIGEDEPDPEEDEEEGSPLDRLPVRQGRSMGIELLVRKKAMGPFFGWISYTLSRAERHGKSGWKPYEYDRTHVLNAVLGIQLPRGWELGWRFQVQDGIPTRNGRLAPFTRLDLRIDRRVVYREWMLDFYIDVINVMVAPEPLDTSESAPPIRYLLPTLGFRAVL